MEKVFQNSDPKKDESMRKRLAQRHSESLRILSDPKRYIDRGMMTKLRNLYDIIPSKTGESEGLFPPHLKVGFMFLTFDNLPRMQRNLNRIIRYRNSRVILTILLLIYE